MKALLFFALAAFTTQAQAADCPVRSVPAFSCKNAPLAGDSEVLSGMFDSIEVCNTSRTGSRAVWVLEKAAQQETAQAKVRRDMKSITYFYDEPDFAAALSIPKGARPGMKIVQAKLSLDLKKSGLGKMTSTFNCERK